MAHFQKLQKQRFEAFLKQDPEMGDLDVTFVFGKKKLFAHKFMLAKISSTFAAIFSNDDKPILVKTYSFTDFRQFLNFLYFGECEFTANNIFALVDIAEFYQVSPFKDQCEEYLTQLKFTLENVFKLLDVALKYSLVKLKKSLIPFVQSNLWSLINDKQFKQCSKDVCLEVVAIEQSHVEREEIFEKVYEWAKKQAMATKKLDQNLILEETAKEILADFLPLFNFAKMSHSFVMEFVVGKSLLASGPELSAILVESSENGLKQVKVEMYDNHGKVLNGRFYDRGNINEEIQKLANTCSSMFSDKSIFWRSSRQGRPSQEKLKKRDGVAWYLVYDSDNDIAVKHRIAVDDSKDYLIAELFAENGNVFCFNAFIRSCLV